jgi:DNA-binding transcriptional MerR regulator
VSDVTEGTTRDQEELTIDALAQRTGMTVRNIRAYQSRGLLPPPEVRGRTGYYGAEHEARIELVRELQADGFNLEAIKRLLEAGGEGSSAGLLSFTRAIHEPFLDEEPQILAGDDLALAVGTSADPELLRRAIKAGLVAEVGDGSFELRSPQLARAGAELAALGIPVEAGLDVVFRLRRHADGVARAFVELFIEQVWKPFDEAGRPPERWPEIVDALERLRPLAAESLLAVFKLTMTDAVDRAFGREMERVRREAEPRSGRRRRRVRAAE